VEQVNTHHQRVDHIQYHQHRMQAVEVVAPELKVVDQMNLVQQEQVVLEVLVHLFHQVFLLVVQELQVQFQELDILQVVGVVMVVPLLIQEEL
tara:strand:- start:45 stop:323 length:279 start_codon:yes stop_codon:yes gene_type:complete